jgi:hypothetical protein
MTSFSRRAALAAVICAGLAAAPAFASPAGAIRISQAWCPAPPPGAPTAAGYLTITNAGHTADRLTGASSPAANAVQLHSMTMEGQIMRMRAVTGGLPIAVGQTRAIQPGGKLHLMLIGLKRPFKPGDRIPVTLDFAHAGAVRTVFTVDAKTPMQPGMQMAAHGHMNGEGH